MRKEGGEGVKVSGGPLLVLEGCQYCKTGLIGKFSRKFSS